MILSRTLRCAVHNTENKPTYGPHQKDPNTPSTAPLPSPPFHRENIDDSTWSRKRRESFSLLRALFSTIKARVWADDTTTLPLLCGLTLEHAAAGGLWICAAAGELLSSIKLVDDVEQRGVAILLPEPLVAEGVLPLLCNPPGRRCAAG